MHSYGHSSPMSPISEHPNELLPSVKSMPINEQPSESLPPMRTTTNSGVNSEAHSVETPNNPQYPQRAWTAPHGGTRRLFSHTGYHRSQSDTPRSSTDMQNVAPNVQYGQYQGPQQNIPPGKLYQAVGRLGQPECPPHPQGGGSNIDNMPQNHQQPLAKSASHWVRFPYCIVQCH